MTAFRAAFKAYRMHQVLLLPRFARLTIALSLATAVFPVDAEYYFNPRFLSNDLAESVDLSAFTKGREAPPGTYRVDIYLNDEFMTSRDITFIADDNNADLIPCLSTDLLVSLGIKKSALLDNKIQPGQNLVVDLSQHISCWNDYGGWYDTDHINLVQGSAFAGSLQSYKGSLYWNSVTYPFPLTTNTNVLDIGDKTPMPLPLKLYITPVGAAGGVVIKAGEVIARIHMYKIATLGSGNPRNFTWNIISNNSVVMPTGGCTVDSRNVTVNLPDFPGSAEIPLGVYCSSEQKLSFYLSGATIDSARQVFANTAPDATKASGVGVSLMRNGKILATGENVSLGTVNKSKVPLGLSATYGQTGNKVSAGTVQSVIGVTFIYE
ncbi:fimbrial-like adhesin protein [Escherichia coli O145:H28]|nr:fimbrial protein [Escherichia coli]GEE94290.1 fimbrial-like adhesin protein [Escherichia coli O145:H28]